MTTVINSPGNREDSGMGIFFGVVGALILIALFFVFVLPTLRDTDTTSEEGTTQINVQLPPAPTPDPVTN